VFFVVEDAFVAHYMRRQSLVVWYLPLSLHHPNRFPSIKSGNFSPSFARAPAITTAVAFRPDKQQVDEENSGLG